MKRKITFLIAVLCAIIIMTTTRTVWAQSDKSAVYTSNVTLPSSGTNVSSCTINIGSSSYSGTKLGKNGSGASASITAPIGTKYIHLHVAAWNGKSTGFTYQVGTANAVSISDITSNSGISNNSPFTWATTSGNHNPNSTYHYKVITLASALENATTITFASTDERVVFWGVNCEKTHTITYSATNGSISGVLYNTSTVVASGDPIVEGGKVTLTATPTEGYSFSCWSVEGTGSTLSSTSTNPTIFTMGTVNATVTATFEIASVCATPTFTVAEGTYNSAQSVELNCTTDGATIYYTTDGTDPTTSSSVYSSAIAVNVSKTIKAFAVKAGLENSSIASATYTLKCATPTITVPGGAFLNTKTVTMETTSDGASIYFTTDESTPTSSSTAYDPSNKPTINATTTFKAIAIKGGWTDSEVATETFTKITPSTVASALTIIAALDDNGTIENQYVAGKISQIDEYYSNYKSITYWISDDGTTTSQLEVYSGKGLNGADFSAETDLTVGEMVVIYGTLKKYVSGTTTIPEFISGSQQISITHKVKAPTFFPVAGAVAAGTNITISTSTEGATIYYTTDGSTPTKESSVYSTPITVNEAMTIKAFAIKDDYIDSSVSEAAYTIAEPCATPTFSVAEGEVEKGTTITISTETDGATIYYTTNGTTPTTSSTAYSSAITINSAMTIKAIAAKDGMANSEVASAAYTVRDYAILPFVWAGGVKGDLTALSGITANGLGSGYGDTHNPYNIQFDGTGDYIQIKTDSQPTKVTIGVKMIGGNNTSKITVQESSNGSSFTDVQDLSISGAQNSIKTLTTTNAFKSSTRYVRLYFTKGSNIGVGPITIDMSGSQTFTNYTIPANNTITIVNGSVLTITGTLTNSGNASNLIIEDGGQLILANTNTGVAATVKKDVSAATAASKTDATYWYALSADVENPSISSNTNLITESGGDPTYDLYRLNEEKNAGDAWENYRNALYSTSFTTLEKGRGYLYRNASDLTITMTGDINVEDFTYDVTKTDDGEYAGFNLIGNPYTHDIYKGTGTAITNGTSTLSTGFYYLEPSTGKWAKGTDQSTAIAPNQGILVQVDATGYINMTNTISNGSAKSNNDYIMLSVANSQYSDEAYAWFDKGIGLNKIEHRNSEIPMLYINQNGENFAIATMSDETQSFNLNFKAATMGKYTLNYETKGEYSYLHVIDRLTGEDVDMLMDGEYSFIASPSDSENRFIVRLEYSAGSEISESSIFAYQSGNDIIVNGEGELQIFDMMGRRVLTQYVSGVETINLQLNGVFIFKLNEKTQKIVVR